MNEAGTPAVITRSNLPALPAGDITSNDSIRFINKAFRSSSGCRIGLPPATSVLHPPALTRDRHEHHVTGTGVPPAVFQLMPMARAGIHTTGARVTLLRRLRAERCWKSGANLFKFEITSIYQNGVTGEAFPYCQFQVPAIISPLNGSCCARQYPRCGYCLSRLQLLRANGALFERFRIDALNRVGVEDLQQEVQREINKRQPANPSACRK